MRGRFHLESDAPRTKLESPTATVVTIIDEPGVARGAATSSASPAEAKPE